MAVLKPSGKKFIKYLLPVLIWAGLIFFVSSVPGNTIPRVLSQQDIILHAIVYAVFGWFVIRAFKKYYPGPNHLKYILVTVIISFIYAMGDEFHQKFIPYRDPSLVDVLSDTLGAIIGSLFFLVDFTRSFRLSKDQVRPQDYLQKE